MAYKLVTIDKNVICNAIEWVITRSQGTDGSFGEIGEAYDASMMVCTSYNTI